MANTSHGVLWDFPQAITGSHQVQVVTTGAVGRITMSGWTLPDTNAVVGALWGQALAPWLAWLSVYTAYSMQSLTVSRIGTLFTPNTSTHQFSHFVVHAQQEVGMYNQSLFVVVMLFEVNDAIGEHPIVQNSPPNPTHEVWMTKAHVHSCLIIPIVLLLIAKDSLPKQTCTFCWFHIHKSHTSIADCIRQQPVNNLMVYAISLEDNVLPISNCRQEGERVSKEDHVYVRQEQRMPTLQQI